MLKDSNIVRGKGRVCTLTPTRNERHVWSRQPRWPVIWLKCQERMEIRTLNHLEEYNSPEQDLFLMDSEAVPAARKHGMMREGLK